VFQERFFAISGYSSEVRSHRGSKGEAATAEPDENMNMHGTHKHP